MRPPSFNALGHVGTRQLQRRQQSEQDAGDDGENGGEEEHGAVERRFIETRQVGRSQRDHDLQAGPRHGESRGRSGNGQQHALRQQLRDDLPAAGAERSAHGDFAAPHVGARELEVGDVRARDQQHERHRSEQDQERAAHLSGDEFLRRDHAARKAAKAAVRSGPHVTRLHPSRRDHRQLGRRRLRRHPVLQSRETKIGAAAPGAEVRGVDDFGHPRFRRPRGRVVVRQAERRRHHADDRARQAVHLDRSANDVGGAAEAPLPQAVTDHDHVARAAGGVRGREGAAEHRGGARHLEEIRRRRSTANELGLRSAREARVGLPVAGDVNEALRLARIGVDLAQRQVRRLGAIGSPDRRQPIGVAVGQRD